MYRDVDSQLPVWSVPMLPCTVVYGLGYRWTAMSRRTANGAVALGAILDIQSGTYFRVDSYRGPTYSAHSVVGPDSGHPLAEEQQHASPTMHLGERAWPLG